MSPDWFFCVALGVLIIGMAVFVVSTPDNFAAVAGFVVLGLFLAIAWMALAAPDVALTEAVVGGGVAGALLVMASARLPDKAGQAGPGTRLLAATACAGVSAGLIAMVLSLPDPAPSLATAAMESLPRTGVGNPVTAVLLAYRAFDTLLETVVVLLALVGVWSLARDEDWGDRPAFGYPMERGGALVLLARVLLPLGLVFGAYLLWTGADHPGGKFQGGAILAAMGILGWLAGMRRPPELGRARLRVLVVAGPAVFLVFGLGGLAYPGTFLAWPEGFSKPVILLIELALLPSLAVILGLLVAGPSRNSRT
jgi:multisubunit Na+/H+ antiporter MnhB subunit